MKKNIKQSKKLQSVNIWVLVPLILSFLFILFGNVFNIWTPRGSDGYIGLPLGVIGFATSSYAIIIARTIWLRVFDVVCTLFFIFMILASIYDIWLSGVASLG